MSEQSQSTIPEPQPESGGPSYQPTRRRAPGIVFPLILIFIGVVLLLYTTGVVHAVNWWRLWILWPALLVLLGLDILLRRSPVIIRIVLALVVLGLLTWAAVYLATAPGLEEMPRPLEASWPLQEGTREGQVAVNLGAGRLNLEALGAADAGQFAQVDLVGVGASGEPFRVDGTVARLDLSQAGWPRWGWPFWQGDIVWSIGLTSRVPMSSLRIEGGAGESYIRAEDLQVRDLKVDLGIGKISCTLPVPTDSSREWTIHAGIGEVDLTVPDDVAVRIRTHTGIGGVSAGSRFVHDGDSYRSPACGAGAKCVDLNIDVGIGSIDLH